MEETLLLEHLAEQRRLLAQDQLDTSRGIAIDAEAQQAKYLEKFEAYKEKRSALRQEINKLLNEASQHWRLHAGSTSGIEALKENMENVYRIARSLQTELLLRTAQE